MSPLAWPVAVVVFASFAMAAPSAPSLSVVFVAFEVANATPVRSTVAVIAAAAPVEIERSFIETSDVLDLLD